MIKKDFSGKEVRYLLKQNSVNLSWLAEQLGISPQSLQERLKAQSFKRGNLLEIAKTLGLSHQHISFYSARKSFVQHGFDMGISIEVLEYCIGQTVKTNRPIYNYYKVMARHADEAIRKILDNLKGNVPSHHG